jgi:hypothetical protein
MENERLELDLRQSPRPHDLDLESLVSQAASSGWHSASDHQNHSAASSPHINTGISPNSTAYSTFDEFTNDPRFLESQQEFRSLLFTSAQSAAPTRRGSPVYDAVSNAQTGDALSSIVSSGSRIIWLQNYLDEVVLWVGPQKKTTQLF